MGAQRANMRIRHSQLTKAIKQREIQDGANRLGFSNGNGDFVSLQLFTVPPGFVFQKAFQIAATVA